MVVEFFEVVLGGCGSFLLLVTTCNEILEHQSVIYFTY